MPAFALYLTEPHLLSLYRRTQPVSWDTECYRGIKPMAEGHPKPRIGSEEDTSNIASPLV